jgi:anti-sigma factor ChrR (cupin superfamily)
MIEHDIAELLPFYANGTLDAADRARVEAELATCTSCAGELRELHAIAAALKARAGDAPALPPHVLADALARLGSGVPSGTVSTLRTAWWGTPARYATAAALVVGFGAVAAAAYHAHEAQVAATTGFYNGEQLTSVFRVTPGPGQGQQHVVRGAPMAVKVVPAKPAADAANAVAKQHRLAKKARIELLVRDVEASLKQAQSTVHDAGGDVTALNDASPSAANVVHTATVDVEVPAERLEGTLDSLARLGAVQTRAIDAEDLDASIVDQEARLRNLRRAEVDLRTLMDKGGKVGDILTVQQNLNEVRGQIEQLDAQHRHDLHRVATSTIQITLSEDRPNAAPAKPGPTARIDGAWHNGLSTLADTVVSLLAAVAWCAAFSPIALALGALAYAATRLLKRRPASA